jgi:MscS family membrane protein
MILARRIWSLLAQVNSRFFYVFISYCAFLISVSIFEVNFDILGTQFAKTYIMIVLVFAMFSLAPILEIISHLYYKVGPQEILDERSHNTRRGLFVFIGQIVAGVAIIFALLTLLGISPAGLLAGAGITAIILGFALQNVFADIFSTLSIYLDQPFKVGDLITINNTSGNVKRIGLKTTRIKLLHGEELAVANTELVKTSIHNIDAIKRRRVEIDLTIVMSTSEDKLDMIHELIKSVVNFDNQDRLASFDSCTLYDINAYSFVFKIIYHIESGEWETYIRVKDRTLRQLIRDLRYNNIEMAYPTQTVEIKK